MESKSFLLGNESQWKQLTLWESLQIFRIPQLAAYLLAGLIGQVILINTSYQDMVVPDIILQDSTSNTYTTAMNPTFAYPLKLGDNLCYPSELSQCINDTSSSSSCCQEFYDKNSWPAETVTVLEEFLIIFFTALTMTIIRLQLWKSNSQRSFGIEYCNKFWALLVWDTLLGIFLTFEYSYFVTNYLKNSVSAPRPFYYAAKIYGSIHSDHRAPIRGDATKSFPSGHAATSMSTLGYLTFLTLEDVYHLSKSFTWNTNFTILMYHYALIPFFLAVWISASRIHDYWHFAADVVAAVIIGLLCATFSLYHLSYYSRSIFNVTYESIRREKERMYTSNEVNVELLRLHNYSKSGL